MRKICYCLLLLSTLSITTLEAKDKKIKIGFKGGANLSNADVGGGFIQAAGRLSQKQSFSIYFGLMTEFPLLGDLLALRVEGLFNSNNVKELEIGEVVSNLNLNQVNVPVLAKLQVFKNLAALAGPYFSFVLKAEQEDENATNKVNISDQFKKFETGLTLGVELNLVAGLFIDLSYNYGLVDLADFKNIAAGTQKPSLENRIIHIGVGIKF